MKKNILYMLALAAGMVACTDDYTDWADPQQNGAEDEQSVSFSATSASAIDYSTIEEGASVKVFTPTVQAEEGATVAYDVAFTDGSAVAADEEGQISSTDLRTVIENIYGKRPVQRTLDAEVAAYITVNGQAIKRTAPITVVATLTAPVIESAYYFVGTNNNWNITDATYKFSHSDKDVYEDPAFTLTIAAPLKDDGSRDDLWFKIAPQSVNESSIWDAIIGCESDGDTSLSGKLKIGGGAIHMPADDGAKMYKIALDMMEYTYTITPLSFDEYIYMPGNHQGWVPATAEALRTTNFDGVYTGYAYMNGDFKFTKKRTWTDGEYNSGDFTTYNGGVEASTSGTNISQPNEGYYQVVADVANGTLTTTAITTWGLIGPATPGGWDSDIDMTWNATDKTWAITAELNAGEFKFRANDGWDINLGGTADDLVENGANISIEEAGTYTITLYTERTDSDKIYFTITK